MKAIISGYFGFKNVGDEMIYEVLKSYLPTIGIKPIFLMNSKESDNSIFRYDFPRIINEIRNSDLVISGGGGILQDTTSSKSFLYYISILKLAEIYNKKTVVFAQGIGPIQKRYNKDILKKVLNNTSLITVRDNFSKGYLEKVGVIKETFVTSDLGFLYNNIEKFNLPFEKYILLSIVSKAEKKYFELVEIIKNIKKISKLPVCIIPFFPEKDFAISEKIANQTDSLLIKELSLQQICYLASNAEFSICSRYHSALLSGMYGVPFISLSYDPKVSNISEEFKMKSFSYENVKPDVLSDIFSELFSKRQSLRKEMLEISVTLKRNAEKNFDLLKQLISS